MFTLKALGEILLSPLYFFMQWLAEESILFTTVKEGTAKIIMKGKSFDHVVMSFKNYHINDPRKPWYKRGFKKETGTDGTREKIPDWEVVYHGRDNKKGFVEKNDDGENEQDDNYYDDRPRVLKKLGLYWVGWPWSHSIYCYPFVWNEASTERHTGELKILPRAEPSDFVYVADFTYVIPTCEAETKERLALNLTTLVTVAIRNPYRALFDIENWIQRTTAAINLHIRTFVGSRLYKELIAPAGADEDAKIIENKWAAFSDPIIALNHGLPGDKEGKDPAGLMGRVGVKIRAADLQTIDLAGEGKERNQEAATEAYAAEQKAVATILDGEARSKVIKMLGESEADSLKNRLKIIQENGEAGSLLAQLDAMQESSKGPGNTIIWATNPFIPLAGKLKSGTKGDETQ